MERYSFKKIMEKAEFMNIANEIGNNKADDVFDLYDKHAERYNEFFKGLGIPDHQLITDYLAEKGFPKDTLVLDAGCGAGACAKALKEAGWENLVGIDGSHGMINEAKKLNVLKEVHFGFVGIGQLPQDLKGRFKLAVTAGTFVANHFPSQAVDEIMFEALTGEKGDSFIIIFRSDAYEELGYKEHIAELVEKGKIRIVESKSFERETNPEEFKDALYSKKCWSLLVHLELS